MNTFLNLSLLVVCSIWFHNTINKVDKNRIEPIIITYLLGSFLIIFLSLLFPADFLDGVVHLIAAGISSLLFWITTTIIIVHSRFSKNAKSLIKFDLIKTFVLLLLPILLWGWISDQSIKIGG